MWFKWKNDVHIYAKKCETIGSKWIAKILPKLSRGAARRQKKRARKDGEQLSAVFSDSDIKITTTESSGSAITTHYRNHKPNLVIKI